MTCSTKLVCCMIYFECYCHTSEMLQQLNFAQGALCEDLLAEDIGDFLDRDALVGLSLDRSTMKRLISSR